MSEKSPNECLINVINSLRQKILTIREMIDCKTGFKQEEAQSLLNEGLFDLIEIKNLNEIVQMNCENKKDECDEIKENVGKDNLNKQKYEYNLDLITNDICRNQELPKLPESNKVISDEDNDKTKIEIETFKNILLNRKRLDKDLKDIKEEKKRNDNILKNKLNLIKNIPKLIENIEKEVNKTKNLFNENNN